MMADEYIKREDALKALFAPGMCYAPVQVKIIKGLPAADVAPVRHGEWQGEGDGYADGALVYDVWRCSECDYCIDDGTDDPERLPRYCPHCGARMDGGDNGVPG